MLGLPDLGGCGHCFKHPLTPDNSSRALPACARRIIVGVREARTHPTSTFSVFLFPILHSLPSSPPLLCGGGASPFCQSPWHCPSIVLIYMPSPSPIFPLSTHHLAQQHSAQNNPTSRPNDPAFTMVVRDYTTVNLRLPQTSHPNLAHLNDHVEHRRPKPKIEPRPPEYYQNLIDQHDKMTVKRNYADTTKDNLQDIIDKFSR